MKLLRWAVAGAASASVYVVYRYSIGKKAKGEDVFASPDQGVAKLDDARVKAKPAAAKPKAASSKSRESSKS
jgi:hypothetical protein